MKTISIIISFFLIRLKEGFASYNFITSFIIQFLKYNKQNKTKLSYFSYIPTSSKRNLFFFFLHLFNLHNATIESNQSPLFATFF